MYSLLKWLLSLPRIRKRIKQRDLELLRSIYESKKAILELRHAMPWGKDTVWLVDRHIVRLHSMGFIRPYYQLVYPTHIWDTTFVVTPEGESFLLGKIPKAKLLEG